MSVDPRYLMAAWGFEVLVLGLAMLPVLFYSPFGRVARLTGVAMCCAWLGISLAFWSEHLPDTGRLVVAPGLLLVGSRMFYGGMRQLFGLRASPRWERVLVGVAFLSVVGIRTFGAGYDGLASGCVVVVALLLALTPAHWLYDMVRSHAAPWSVGTRLLAVGGGGAALLNGLRGVVTLFGGGPVDPGASPVSAAAVAGFMVTTILLGVGVLLEVQHRTNREWMRSNSRLNQEALTDSLTGIGNRRHFDLVAAKLQERARSSRGQLSLLMMDIDHFKSINDRFGHDVGDQVLRDVVAICRQVLRDGDLFTRWGGEEFAILLPDAPPHIAEQVAHRIRSAVQSARPNVLEGASVTVSIGVASVDPDAPDIVDAQLRADLAMLEAKRAGRNQCRVAPPVTRSAPPVALNAG